MQWFTAGLVRLVARIPASAALMKALYGLTRPRVTLGVVGLIVNAQGQILLAEHVFHPEHPWGLPGGWIEAGENPAEALRREIREELGLSIAIERPLLAVASRKHFRHLDLSYLCRPEGEPGALSFEISSYAWFEAETLELQDEFQRAVLAHYRSLFGTGSPV